jgi:hypothetical protein
VAHVAPLGDGAVEGDDLVVGVTVLPTHGRNRAAAACGLEGR